MNGSMVFSPYFAAVNPPSNPPHVSAAIPNVPYARPTWLVVSPNPPTAPAVN